jgi:NADH-quinone oxidoreductase subunit M
MILFWLIVIPLLAGIVAWIAARWSTTATRWICLGAMAADLATGLALWFTHSFSIANPAQTRWSEELVWNWIPTLGIRFHLALDGLSLILLLLTFFLGIMAVLTSWTEIEHSVGFFHFNLMWVLAGVTGVFLAVDLFLFYMFWELMLIPMYFLIAIWGHENRIYASVKFFLFTQLSGLLMLAAIIALAILHQRATGVWTFDYEALLSSALAGGAGRWVMLGFVVAFAVKLPAFPVHTWLPDAHTEAPTAGSLVLAGLLLKTGAYGLIRFVLPLFPGEARSLAPLLMTLGKVISSGWLRIPASATWALYCLVSSPPIASRFKALSFRWLPTGSAPARYSFSPAPCKSVCIRANWAKWEGFGMRCRGSAERNSRL